MTQTERIQVRLTLRGESILLNKIEKLNRRAKRLHVEPVKVRRVSPWVIREDKDDNGVVVLRLDWADFEVTTEIPCLNGWKFLCRIEHTGAGNILSVRPDADPSGVLVAMFSTCGPKCEHCNKPRDRKDTYVVLHSDGRMMQVGSSCLADVLGLGASPEDIAKLAEWLSELNLICCGGGSSDDDERWDSYGGKAANMLPVESFLSLVAKLVRIDGYISNAYARENYERGIVSTSDDARYHMSPPSPSYIGSRKLAQLRERYGNYPICPDEEDKEMARRALSWAQGLEGKTEFEHNLRTIANNDVVEYRNSGIAAYIVEGYRRAMAKDAEQKIKDSGKPASFHLGEIGKRMKKVSVTFLGTPFTGENDYGTFYIHRFVTDDGAELVWKTGNSVNDDAGTKLVADFTPKKHGEYNGRPQTEISRMKLENA